MIGIALLSIITGFFGYWFMMQRQYQERITRISDVQEKLRRASWDMIQELQTSRSILWPRLNADKSIHTDSKMVFKDMQGNFVAYYHVPATRELRRCVIPNGPGSVELDGVPIAAGIASVSFTAGDFCNRLISFHLSSEGVHTLDAVYLLNFD
jgi:hypothetical protein